ncbi:MAG: SH3 domain-containing protein [Clostridia bacterium]|nr:SH3 domain-containing protein [Clostridia bacterium]
MKKRLAFVLCLVLLMAAMPFGGASAEEQMLTLAELRQKYPHGTYWNHTAGGNEDYTLTPCTHHAGNCTYNGSCGCNTYQNAAIQCMGFAYQLASLAYGCDPRAEWTTDRAVSALDTLKAGDIVRYRWNGHSIFVTGVEGDTVTYADANGDGRCKIQWDRTVTKETLAASFTYVKAAPYALATEPALTVTYHGGGGRIENTVAGHTYRVLSTNGINMRAGAGTDQAKVTALPHGTVFTVAVGDTKEASGYTWGKTAYNGKTGWVVISDFVEQIGTVWDGEWTLSDGLVCHRDGGVLTDTFPLGEPMAALYVPEEIGLYREGHRFAGWNTAADGSGVTFAAGMLPEELWADGDAVTLYALWAPILPGDANGDGRRNNHDLALLQRYLAGWQVTVCADADVNADGAVNNQDVGLLQRILNEWDWKENAGC